MADIQMCSGNNCPLKRNCKRFTANVGMWQYYFNVLPYNFKTKICDKFWNINTDKD